MVLTALKRIFGLQTDQPELLVAQAQAYSRLVPLLYGVLLVNMVFVALTYLNVGNPYVTLGFPVGFTLIACVRVRTWLRTRGETLTPDLAEKRLRSTIRLAVVFGLSCAMWSIYLLQLGTPYQKFHVAFFMMATLVACVFCLMHLRPAAFALAGIVSIPLCIVFISSQSVILPAIGVNFLILVCTMMYLLSWHHDDFATMIAQRTSLIRNNEETRRLNDENHKLANLDALTGLSNRRVFISSIDAAVAKNDAFAIGLIDLDGFKAVNDLHGHAAGDALLIEASRRLRSLATDSVQFVRLGGDEFGFIANDVESVTVLGQQICSALGLAYSVNGNALNVTASCGIALFPESCSSTSQLLEYSDYAMYQAKTNATGSALVFTASHRAALHEIHRVDQALRNADLAQEFSLHYQPVVCFKSGRVTALEALARWNSPVLGAVPPATFIATAERSPLINQISLVLLKRLLDDVKQLPQDLMVAFNLSAKTLASPLEMLKVLRAVQSSDVDPKRLIFEVTESALISNFDIALDALSMLRNLGAAIALDDFGTGYSSLNYVHQLPLDKIKIDRRFVNDLCDDVRAQKIVQTIVGLSRDLSLKCVAEGVETARQAEVLSQIGCDLMQGYHFSKPLPLEELTVFLARFDADTSMRVNVA